MTDTRTEDFLDAPAYGEPDDGVSPAPPRRRGRFRSAGVTAGWLVVGLVLGAVGVAAVHASHSSSTAAGPAGAATAQGGPLQGAPGQGGPGFGGPGQGGGGFGGFAGEQHVFGTLAAVNGSTLTVQTPTGTSTYTIDTGTVLVKDGQQVSSLSAMQVGDAVVVHVYPRNGGQHVEVVIDGGTAGDDNNGSGAVTHT